MMITQVFSVFFYEMFSVLFFPATNIIPSLEHIPAKNEYDYLWKEKVILQTNTLENVKGLQEPFD